MNTQPRIALIRQRFSAFGGAERFAAAALAALAAQGAALTIISRDWPEQPGVRRLLLRPFHFGRLWRDAAFARAACAAVAAGGFDLVQAHERVPCCDIWRAGDGLHAAWLEARDTGRPAWRRWLTRLSPYHRATLAAERRLLQAPRLKAVVCNSHWVACDMSQRHPALTDRLVVIHNAVDSERFHPGLAAVHRAAVRTALGLAEDTPLALFLGSGYERKGLETALRALRLADARWHLLAAGKDRAPARWQRLAARLGVAQRVHFLGPQTEPERCYAAADVLLFPSRYDPFPNTVLEAMACGLPALVSDQCGAVDIVTPACGTVLPAHDAGVWAAALDACLNHARRAALGAQARLAVLPLTPARMQAEYAALYARLLPAAAG
jgi:UDP-glucose:(heptosyl)LPS alpha-1,3-glucosyltransferase